MKSMNEPSYWSRKTSFELTSCGYIPLLLDLFFWYLPSCGQITKREKMHTFLDDFSFTNQKEIDSIAYVDRMRQGHLKKKDEAQL